MSFSSEVKKEILSKGFSELFLRDAFLSYGTMTDPNKCYHLEFVVSDKSVVEKIVSDISKIKDPKIETGISVRNNSYVVYIKACESIMDFLVYIGATSSAMKMMQIKMVKDLRNRVNRTTNFETANLDKIVQAADNHIDAIKKIENTVGISSLPDDLYEIAKLRIENPEMSLKELGEKLENPISKSGVNHRLKKIIKISETL